MHERRRSSRRPSHLRRCWDVEVPASYRARSDSGPVPDGEDKRIQSEASCLPASRCQASPPRSRRGEEGTGPRSPSVASTQQSMPNFNQLLRVARAETDRLAGNGVGANNGGADQVGGSFQKPPSEIGRCGRTRIRSCDRPTAAPPRRASSPIQAEDGWCVNKTCRHPPQQSGRKSCDRNAATRSDERDDRETRAGGLEPMSRKTLPTNRLGKPWHESEAPSVPRPIRREFNGWTAQR